MSLSLCLKMLPVATLQLVALAASTATVPQNVELVFGEHVVSTTADKYICVGTDWWPSNKCDYEGENGRTHAQVLWLDMTTYTACAAHV